MSRVFTRDKEFLLELGKKIAEIRKQKGLSQYKLSYETNISRSTIKKLEKGEINSSLSIVPFIARALKVHPKDLLDFDFDYQEDNY